MTGVKSLVIFAILMEHGEGIVGKSVEYILEKFDAVVKVPYPEELLDYEGKAKLKRWEKNWLGPE